jgi:outer membrane murein-binding lipoprotein Lpp
MTDYNDKVRKRLEGRIIDMIVVCTPARTVAVGDICAVLAEIDRLTAKAKELEAALDALAEEVRRDAVEFSAVLRDYDQARKAV